MRAIILAAGEGTRLRPYTLDRPKCLVELDGVPLLTHQIEALRAADVDDVTIVTGYRADQISVLGRATRHNPDYAYTNMVASLMRAADLLDGSDDVLVAYGDIVYEPWIVRAVCACQEAFCTAVDRSWLRLWTLRANNPLSDAETLKLDASEHIIEIGRKPRWIDDVEGQYMGLTRLRADFAPTLASAYQRLSARRGDDPARLDMTRFLQHLIDGGHPVKAVMVDGGWLEVDTAGDLETYNELAANGALGKFYGPAAAVA